MLQRILQVQLFLLPEQASVHIGVYKEKSGNEIPCDTHYDEEFAMSDFFEHIRMEYDSSADIAFNEIGRYIHHQKAFSSCSFAEI